MSAVSVVIPFRDVTAYLPDALDSLCAQTFRDFEVLLADDGSSAGCGDLVARYAGRLDLRLFRLPARGVSAARNAAAREARGACLAFLDADDAWLPTKLETQFARFAGGGAVLSYGNVVFVDESGRPLGKDLKLSRGLSPLPEGDCLPALTGGNFVMPSTLMVRAEDYFALGGFDEAIGFTEDWDFALKASRRGPFMAIQEALVRYRRHPGCVTLSAKHQEQRRLVVERLLTLVPEPERAAVQSYLTARETAEDAFLAVSQGRLGPALWLIAHALRISPAAARDVAAVRASCWASRMKHKLSGG